MKSVCITGVTGFVGSHVAAAFLNQGWRVKGTARSAAKATHLVNHFNKFGNLFSIALVPDMALADAFDDVVQGVDVIVHVASVVRLFSDSPFDDVYVPSVAGTLSILNSAQKSRSVKRFVMTSSTGAIYDFGLVPPSPTHLYTESDWDWSAVKLVEQYKNEVFPVFAYLASKTKSEAVMWDFMKENNPHFDAVSINPPFVFGPFFHLVQKSDQLSDSLAMVLDIATGKKELRPKSTFDDFIDVRDVASIHVLASTLPAVSGLRILIGSGPFEEAQIASLCRTGAIKEAAPICSHADTSRMQRLFMTECTPFTKSILETTKSLVDAGLADAALFGTVE